MAPPPRAAPKVIAPAAPKLTALNVQMSVTSLGFSCFPCMFSTLGAITDISNPLRKGGEGRKNRTVWARGELVATVIKAVKAGARPTEVTSWSPFTCTCGSAPGRCLIWTRRTVWWSRAGCFGAECW